MENDREVLESSMQDLLNDSKTGPGASSPLSPSIHVKREMEEITRERELLEFPPSSYLPDPSEDTNSLVIEIESDCQEGTLAGNLLSSREASEWQVRKEPLGGPDVCAQQFGGILKDGGELQEPIKAE